MYRVVEKGNGNCVYKYWEYKIHTVYCIKILALTHPLIQIILFYILFLLLICFEFCILQFALLVVFSLSLFKLSLSSLVLLSEWVFFLHFMVIIWRLFKLKHINKFYFYFFCVSFKSWSLLSNGLYILFWFFFFSFGFVFMLLLMCLFVVWYLYWNSWLVLL